VRFAICARYLFSDTAIVSPFTVDVQHHVNVGAAVAHVNHPVVAHRQLGAELLEQRYLAISGGDPLDRWISPDAGS